MKNDRKMGLTGLDSLFAPNSQVSLAALQIIVESIPAGVIVIEQANGKIAYVNKRFNEITGFNPIGFSFREYALNMAKARNLDTGPFLYEQLPLIQALLDGKTTRNYEISLKRPDGLSLTILVNTKPIINEKQAIIGAVGVFEDITERKKAEEALKGDEERHAFLLKLSDAIRPLSESVEIQAIITQFARELFRTDRCYYCRIEGNKAIIERESKRKNLPSVIGVYDIDRLPIFKAVIDAGRPFVVKDAKTSDLLDEELRKLCIQLQVISFLDVPVIKNGIAVGILCIVHGQPREWSNFDIEMAEEVAGRTWSAVERAHAEQALRQAQMRLQIYAENLEKVVTERTKQLQEKECLAAIGTTAGMVGHDIRNPLQAMTGDIFLLKGGLEELPDSEAKKSMLDDLDAMEQNLFYIDKIVGDLQDFARPLNPRATTIDMVKLVKSQISSFVPKKIKTILSIQPDAQELNTDPDILKRILMNLLTNAVQAMPVGGKLTVTASKVLGYYILSVKDTGVGIPEAIKPKLFTPMFTTKSKGQGFGLPVIKRMTEALGGTVTFESEEGKGTEFVIELPIA